MTEPSPLRRWAIYSSHLGDYMRRWILRTPWFSIRIHNIRKSDEGRDFHDHPFHFVSLILRGGYVEHVPGCPGPTLCRFFAINRYCRRFGALSIVERNARDYHRLELIGGPTWTLVVSSRYFREWGFLRADGSWCPHYEYEAGYGPRPEGHHAP